MTLNPKDVIEGVPSCRSCVWSCERPSTGVGGGPGIFVRCGIALPPWVHGNAERCVRGTDSCSFWQDAETMRDAFVPKEDKP